MGYERHNFYRIYHPLTRKIHKTRDIDIDEGSFYNKSDVKHLELVYEEWENSYDSLFANPLEFEDEKAETNRRSDVIALKEKSVEFLESSIGENDVRSVDQ